MTNFRLELDILLGDKILDLSLTFYLVFECHVEMLCQWAYKGCQLAVNSGVVFVFESTLIRPSSFLE